MSAAEIQSPDGLPVVFAPDREIWRAWLEAHFADEPSGAWLVIHKKGSAEPSITYEDAVQEAVAFGWIDSRANGVDERRYIQRFSRRRPGGAWSQSNRERVAQLTAQGRMAPPGIASVEAAKADGSWEGPPRGSRQGAEGVDTPGGVC